MLLSFVVVVDAVVVVVVLAVVVVVAVAVPGVVGVPAPFGPAGPLLGVSPLNPARGPLAVSLPYGSSLLSVGERGRAPCRRHLVGCACRQKPL